MPPAQATTLRRAKAQYKKSGPVAISSSEQRRLSRQVELDRRAQAVKERDKRRKAAEKARVEREDKERVARKQLGIGLATQLVGYSLTQKQMKGGMEGWLGMRGGGAGERKRKREEDVVEEKENRLDEGGDARSTDVADAAIANESFGSNMSLDEILLEQLDDSTADSGDTTKTKEMPAGEGRVEVPKQDMQVDETNISTAIDPRAPDRIGEAENVTPPPMKRAKTKSSPINEWAQFVDGNTQILSEISQPSPPQVKADPRIAIPHMSTQDLELNSDDFIETGLPKTTNPLLSADEGAIVRDFAYFKHTDSGSFSLTVPGAPALSRKSRTEKSIRRSFGRRPTITKASPKMTATCAEFTAAQCSFTTDYHHYGLSTQILQEALDDGDDDTEDEDEEVYSQALENTKVPDGVLMPPPPITLSPKVFKPPTSARTNLFASKGGLQIFGLSTQLLNDAINDDDVSTDEDSDDALFSIPITRPATGASKSMAKAQTTVAMTAPSTLRRTSSAFGGFGLSTQMLQDAALDDIELTDDEDTQKS